MSGQPDTSVNGGVLELTDLRRTFGPLTALDGLAVAVPPGKLFGFVGRNGAGRSVADHAAMHVAAVIHEYEDDTRLPPQTDAD
jgi:ABC-type uncharacterized transport system ATPase subunit